MHDRRAGDEAHGPVVGEQVDAIAIDEAADPDDALAEPAGEPPAGGIVAERPEREGFLAHAYRGAVAGLLDADPERLARRLEDEGARPGGGDPKTVAPRPGIDPAAGARRRRGRLGRDERRRRDREQARLGRSHRRREPRALAPAQAGV